MKPVLLDTGAIVALLDATDSFHRPCADALAELRAPLITCEPVIAESCYLLHNLDGAAEVILESIASREFLIPITLADMASPVQRIFRKYRDRRIDLADAALIHLANEFQTADILTVDSDFHVYRWGNNNAFRLLVPLR